MRTKSIFSLRPLATAVAILLLIAAPSLASAAFTFTLTQTGGNVLVTGSGTINTTALTLQVTTSVTPAISPTIAALTAGNAGTTQFYSGFTGPTGFGSGGTTNGTGTGNTVAINGNQGFLFVPTGYTSGAALTDTATFANASFSSLGFTPGTYTYTWGMGASADSLTVTSVVPEPSAWAMFLAGGVLLLGMLFRRRSA